MRSESTVVIGAGPYGLSVAAHLRQAGLLRMIIGNPMSFWESMPPGLCLKSPWSASSLADPDRAHTLNRYVASGKSQRTEPIPLSMFIDYCRWFQERAVGNVENVVVQQLSRAGDGFALKLDDGRMVESPRVVVATGIAPFPFIPEFAREIPTSLCRHTMTLGDPAAFAGQDVAVVGAGQSALESAALLHEAGARVEVLARGPVRWADRRLYDHTGFARHLFYPPADVGPVGINWIVAFPRFVRRLPGDLRKKMGIRAIRPSGAKWLRGRVEGRVALTPFTEINEAEPRGDQLILSLGDGTKRRVDQLVLGTGYRPDVSRVAFLDNDLRTAVARDGRGYPRLDRSFQSTVPGLHFAGALALGSFGPLCNFVAGARVAARQIGRHAARAS